MYFKKFLTVLVLFFSLKAISQNASAKNPVYFFKKALFIKSPSHYGREAIYTDELAYRIYTNTLKTPNDDDVFGIDEKNQSLKWLAITADSLNRLFRKGEDEDGFRRNGYIYLTYTSD